MMNSNNRKKPHNARLRKTILEMAEGLYDAGIIDKPTRQEFNALKEAQTDNTKNKDGKPSS